MEHIVSVIVEGDTLVLFTVQCSSSFTGRAYMPTCGKVCWRLLL